MRPQLSYIICCNFRSGSSLLADGLRQTGIAGDPHEYFGPLQPEATPAQQRWRNASTEGYVDRIVELGTSANGVFGVKLHWAHVPEAISRLRRHLRDDESPPPELFSRAFSEPLYISLTRRDKVAQAISFYRARTTKRWWDVTDTAPDATDTRHDRDIAFDFAEIDRLRKYCEEADESWAAFFREHGIEPLTLEYEDFVPAYEATLRSVLSALGVADDGIAIAAPRFRRQADDLSTEWRKRFAETQRTLPGAAG